MSHLDPPAQHRAAAIAGRLAAAGLVEGPPLLAAIRRAAFRAAPMVNRRGLAMRLAHRFADSHHAQLARAAARRRIAHALAPLLEARATAQALRRAAHEADPAEALTPREREAEAEAAIARHLRALRNPNWSRSR
jgi:hypothetical protein